VGIIKSSLMSNAQPLLVGQIIPFVSATLHCHRQCKNSPCSLYTVPKVGTPKTATFCYWAYLLLLDWSNFHIFLLASGRRFQRTRERSIWILHAKVVKEQGLILKVFLPHRYRTNFWRCTHSKDGALRSRAILGVPTLSPRELLHRSFSHSHIA